MVTILIFLGSLDNSFKYLLKIGIKVYITPEKYFVKNTRGLYHTVSNNFYLNDHFMKNTGHLMSVMRHEEGWLTQDRMSGSIDNSFIVTLIRNDEEIPELWKEMAATYISESVVPWEQEAFFMESKDVLKE